MTLQIALLHGASSRSDGPAERALNEREGARHCTGIRHAARVNDTYARCTAASIVSANGGSLLLVHWNELIDGG
jgi:hypothetical protein